MDTLDAAHQLARTYPGGVEALAPRLDKSPHTLRHELTRQGTSKFALLDAEAITLYALEVGQADPLRILNAFAKNVGAVVLMLPDGRAASDDTFQGLADAAQAFSKFVASVAEAVSDRKVTENELKDVERQLSSLIGRAQAIQRRLASMHESSKPAEGA